MKRNNPLQQMDFVDRSGRVDADFVIVRLEEAGSTLMALPGTGFSTTMRAGSIEILRAALENYTWDEKSVRPAVPSAGQISRMDQAMQWMSLIPQDRYVLRRIVGARSLINPVTDRHLYSWRRLAGVVGADHKAVQRWHAQGIDLIVSAINRGLIKTQNVTFTQDASAPLIGSGA